MANVSKKEIVEIIATQTGITQVDAKIVIESFLETIAQSLKAGRNIEIRGFGRFKVKPKKARKARNPRTGESVFVEAGLRPVFEASKDLKNRIN
jgi:DNA-binding protein HU-beta/integration host factor subunit beta